MPTLSSDQKIDQIILSLSIYDMGDIKKAREAGINIAAFILCGCFIDHISRYRYFNIKTDVERFKQFADNYMSSVFHGMGRDLYARFRSSLVHNYSTKGHFVLAWGNREAHLSTYGEKSIYLDIDEFILELERALDTYIDELRVDSKLQTLAIGHYDHYPIMRQLE